MLCKEVEYYEAVTDSCRSCTIPCSFSEAVCKVVGCPLGEFGYRPNPSATTTTSSLVTVNYNSSNCIMDEEADTSASILIPLTATIVMMLSLLIVTVIVYFFKKKGCCCHSNPQTSKTVKWPSDKYLPTTQECQCCIVQDLDRFPSSSDEEIQYRKYGNS